MSKKRPKLLQQVETHHNEQQEQEQEQEQQKQLIPGLPDHIAQLCLSKTHPKFLYPVCPSWINFIYSSLFPPFLSLYTIFTPTSSPTSQLVTPIHFSAFDPISNSWRDLPPPPDPPLQLLLRHPSFISRNLTIQSVAVCDRLVLVAATTQHLLPALPGPLVFNPLAEGKLVEHWRFGPDIPVPRRWCATGALAGSVYVASGVGSHFSTDTARTVEKWDLNTAGGGGGGYKGGVGGGGGLGGGGDSGGGGGGGGDSGGGGGGGGGWRWEKVRPLHDGRFSRESVEAVGWRGRLCMVNVKGYAAKQGAVYDARNDNWLEMAEGMVAGWRGPAASMDERVVYVVDVSKGVLRRYDEVRDVWVNVMENERLRGAKQMAARGGRVCVVCQGGVEIVVVDVVAVPARMWVVQSPNGFNAVAVHILPRMSGVSKMELQ